MYITTTTDHSRDFEIRDHAIEYARSLAEQGFRAEVLDDETHERWEVTPYHIIPLN